jgi:cytochrome c peroxidase
MNVGQKLRHRIVRAVLAACLIASPLVGKSGAADAPLSRDAIWRAIFARPEVAPVPGDEALRQALGRSLFSDTRLSRDGDRSCASCHQPERGYSDGRPRGLGRNGDPLQRNTPHLWNLATASAFYWDGRAPTLEAQARVPLHAANELAADLPRTIARLSSDPHTASQFAAAFPGEPAITEDQIVAALAAFEKTLVSPSTRFDAWVRGDDAALDARERQGFAIFVGKGGCVSCHGGWRMTDDQFHDIGLPSPDPGRGAVAGGTPGIAAFKTPGLRQVARTAPYMHDGSLATLEDVVAHYAETRRLRPSLAPTLVRDLELDPQERAALVAFLKTL